MKTKAEILRSTDEREVFRWIKENGLDEEVCELFNQLVKDENAPEYIDDLALRVELDALDF